MKAGYQTTEFWLATIATTINAVMASGVVPTNNQWVQVIGLIGSTIIPIVYNFLRKQEKQSANDNTLPDFMSNMTADQVKTWVESQKKAEVK